MPYIKEEQRDHFYDSLKLLTNSIGVYTNEDNINSIMSFIIYKLVKNIYGQKSTWEMKSDALKVLEDVKLEYYRRVIAPYSDIKIEINGDV